MFGPLLRVAGSVERPLFPTQMDFKATGSGFFRDPGAKKAGYPAKFSLRAARRHRGGGVPSLPRVWGEAATQRGLVVGGAASVCGDGCGSGGGRVFAHLPAAACTRRRGGWRRHGRSVVNTGDVAAVMACSVMDGGAGNLGVLVATGRGWGRDGGRRGQRRRQVARVPVVAGETGMEAAVAAPTLRPPPPGAQCPLGGGSGIGLLRPFPTRTRAVASSGLGRVVTRHHPELRIGGLPALLLLVVICGANLDPDVCRPGGAEPRGALHRGLLRHPLCQTTATGMEGVFRGHEGRWRAPGLGGPPGGPCGLYAHANVIAGWNDALERADCHDAVGGAGHLRCQLQVLFARAGCVCAFHRIVRVSAS